MTTVVLRCPSCGTTSATDGQCEACHDARVRWFCTNHEPGHWLDGPVCPQCDPAPVRAPVSIAVPVLARSARPEAEWERPSLKQAGGCLMRLALIAVVLLIALAVALFALGRSLGM